MDELKSYFGTKLVNGRPMTRGMYNQFRGWTIPENENPAEEGYLVEYTDGGAPNTSVYAGYVSWSPKDVFERAYRDVSDGMPLGLATTMAKAGCCIARKGWSGKGLFVYYVPAATYPAQTDVAKSYFGAEVQYREYWALCNTDNTVSTWAPSVSDSMAEDWVIVRGPSVVVTPAVPSVKIPEYQQRVIDEKAGIDSNRAKLSDFLSGSVYPTLTVEARDLLQRQAVAMGDLSEILGLRIDAFAK